jgi:hypothetical protein
MTKMPFKIQIYPSLGVEYNCTRDGVNYYNVCLYENNKIVCIFPGSMTTCSENIENDELHIRNKFSAKPCLDLDDKMSIYSVKLSEYVYCMVVPIVPTTAKQNTLEKDAHIKFPWIQYKLSFHVSCDSTKVKNYSVYVIGEFQTMNAAVNRLKEMLFWKKEDGGGFGDEDKSEKENTTKGMVIDERDCEYNRM